jgi:hypothetical protein
LCILNNKNKHSSYWHFCDEQNYSWPCWSSRNARRFEAQLEMQSRLKLKEMQQEGSHAHHQVSFFKGVFLFKHEFVINPWKSLETITICFCISTPSCFILVHISMSLATSTFAHNYNLFLESCTYNFIVEAKTLYNSQYPWNWSTTHVVTTRESISQLP